MSDAFTIRLATTRDLDAIVARWHDLMDAHRALEETLYATATHAPGTYRAFVRRHMSKSASVVLVAEHRDAILGYMLGGKGQRSPIYAVGEVGMIFDLVVQPDLRRAGIGRALVDAAMDWFEERGLEHVQVNFSTLNPSAAQFWPAMGFAPFLCEAYRPVRLPASQSTTVPEGKAVSEGKATASKAMTP